MKAQKADRRIWCLFCRLPELVPYPRGKRQFYSLQQPYFYRKETAIVFQTQNRHDDRQFNHWQKPCQMHARTHAHVYGIYERCNTSRSHKYMIYMYAYVCRTYIHVCRTDIRVCRTDILTSQSALRSSFLFEKHSFPKGFEISLLSSIQ